MAINLNPETTVLKTGTNVSNRKARSPSLSLLGKKPTPADVAPNEDQVMADLAETKGPEVVEAVTPEVPEVTPVPEVAPVPEVTQEPIAEPTVPELLKRPEEPATEVNAPAVEQSVDPFDDAIDPLLLEDSHDVDLAFSDAETVDSTKGAYRSTYQVLWDDVKERTMGTLRASLAAMGTGVSPMTAVAGVAASEFTGNATLEDTNKLAYGAVKGIAGTADLATVPIWAAGHYLVGGNKFPFMSALERNYPEKAYEFGEDPDSYADEVLRFSQTGLEFITSGGVMNAGAKGLTKGAYAVSQSTDAGISAASAFGYQGALEMGAGDGVALLAAFIAPNASEITKAGYKAVWEATAGSTKAVSKPLVYALDKVTDYSVLGVFKHEAKNTIDSSIYVKKQELIANPKMWTETPFKRKARDIVLSVSDKQKTIEQQREEIRNIQRWVSSAFPDTPEVREHVFRMQKLQDDINKELPEDQQIAFTLEQIYAPVLRQKGMVEGLDEVMTVLRVTNGAAYDAQLTHNRKALFEYMSLKKDKMGPEETKAFTDIFDTYLEDVGQVQETIYSLARTSNLIDGSKSVGYVYPEQPVEASLRPAMENLKSFLDEAYDGMLNRLPNEAELDTTPVADAVRDVYDSLGVFADPKSLPTYLKDVVKALTTNAIKGDSNEGYTKLKNEGTKLGNAINEINRDIRELSAKHKVALDQMNPENTEGIKALKRAQKEEMLALQSKHTDLLTQKGANEIAKRNDKAKEVASDLDSLPEPNLVTVGDVAEGLRIVNRHIRKALSNKDREKADVLFKIKEGLTRSMEGLQELDKEAYTLFNVTNDHYKRFVATDFNETLAAEVIEKGDHLYKVTSDKAVDILWENAGSEDMLRFLRNFDGERAGLAEYLDNIPSVSEDQAAKGINLYSAASERAAQAVRDIAYTSLARKLNLLDKDVALDPSEKMDRVKKVIIDFQHKHESKLNLIPGFETFTDDLEKTIRDVAGYREAVRILDERRNLSILRDVVGPGKTATSLMRNRKQAEQMYEFLNNRLPSVTIGDVSDVTISEATANAIRKSLRDGFINEYTRNGIIDHEALDKVLATGTSTRNNLSLILGEQEVLKLDTFRFLGRAMKEGKTQFTEVLLNNSVLRKMDALGLPLGRVASLLQRRAIFQPSTGYVAGAVASKVLDTMGNRQTSRAMQLLIDRPFDVLNLDTVLLKELKDLPPVKQKQLKEVMEGNTRHMRELAAWLPKQLSKPVGSYLGYLGFTELTESEIVGMIEDVLYDDPRHPEFNRGNPDDVPALLKRPEEKPKEQPKEEPEDVLINPALNDQITTDASLEGPIDPQEDENLKEMVTRLQVFKDNGMPKDRALAVIESLKLADNHNKAMILSALDQVYQEEEPK